ncbi:MAG: M20/M25/M40 family metallo-hydrolase [Promethearchaeota archaeon]
MSNEYVIDSDENSDYMYNTIKNIIDTVGPRAPGSEEERKAAELVKKELENFCDSVEIEEFETYPRAFLGWIRLSLGFWLLSFLVFLLSPIQPLVFSLICLGIGLFILFIIWKQFLNYEEWTPKIFPYKKAISQNVVGVIKPSGEVKKRVTYGGHLDSAFRFNLIHYTRQGYAFFLIGGIVALLAFLILYVMQLVYALIAIDLVILTWILLFIIMALPVLFCLFFLVFGKSDKVFFGAFSQITPFAQALILGVTAYSVVIEILMFQYVFIEPTLVKNAILLTIIAIPSFIALFFFASRKATPGAIDNLTAVAPCMCVAKILKEWKEKYPELMPKNTEVVIAIVGSEEIGLRGSEAFAKKHAEEYNKIDTTVVNLESLTESKYQGIFTREQTTRTDLSPEVYNLLAECCKDLGIEYKLEEMPGIAGGTDAAGFVRGGLKSATLIGLKYKDYLFYYHTDRDHYNLINKERRPWEDEGTDYTNRNVRGAMEMALKICFKYLEKKDSE